MKRKDGRAAAGHGVDLRVHIGPMRLANPVLTASGTFGYGDEYAHVMDVGALGGVITKTVTLTPRTGNPPQRIAETAGGMLNSIGLENVGLHAFVGDKLPRLRALGATVIASIKAASSVRLRTRALSSANSARSTHSGCPRRSHNRANSRSLAAPSVM